MLPSFLPPRYHLAFHALIPEVLVKASRGFVRFCVSALIFHFLSSSAIRAQQTAGSASAPSIDPKSYAGMKWRLIGPFRGGRVLTVTGVPSQPNTYYFGAVGDGVYRSNDAGKTWTNVGLKDTRHIGKLVIHPTNPDVVFVAALGHAYGANTERGIFRTRDGGKNWEKVLYFDDRTGGIDIVFDPRNPHILFAAMWEGYRTPWTLNSGGDKDGLFRSNDDGSTWKRVEGHGIPESPLGRIGVAVSGADSNVVYALIEAKKGGLYRSDDGGEHWALITDD